MCFIPGQDPTYEWTECTEEADWKGILGEGEAGGCYTGEAAQSAHPWQGCPVHR